MKLSDERLLCYCSNIHPGEGWKEHFGELQRHLPPLKKHFVSGAENMGLGLRLSDRASRELAQGENLRFFKEWLETEGTEVFTMNGFPYGGFHRTRVKDGVHRPDWLTAERSAYTQRLFGQLSSLLREESEGGISTSPLSYRYWHKESDLPEMFESMAGRLAELALHLHSIRDQKGQFLHLDLEPEPDGLMEDSGTVLHFFKEYLFRNGVGELKKKGFSSEKAEEILRRHIRLCYDVCHYALAWEEPSDTLALMAGEGIGIGKIQISAALKVDLRQDRVALAKALAPYNESVYLHQVTARLSDGKIDRFRDLPEALKALNTHPADEWRCHFHVPVFVAEMDRLSSTQDSILKALAALKKYPEIRHFEVETYTWEVLPQDLQQDLGQSIQRELEWVQENWAKLESS